MDFFQEPTFTAFLALILSFVVAKIVSFAVYNSNNNTNGNVGFCSRNEGTVGKEVAVDRRLRVKSSKIKKKVKFVADVQVRSIDRFEFETGSENLGNLDEFGFVKEMVVDKRSLDDETVEKIDQVGDNGLSEDFGVLEKGFEENEMVIEEKMEGDGLDESFGVNEVVFSTSGADSVYCEGMKEEVELEGDDEVIEEKKGNGEEGCGENEGIVGEDVVEEGEVREESGDTEDDDGWEGVERSELEKVFAEAVNYVEYGGKGKDKDLDQLGKLGSDVQMQLYGLHKVAVEGACHEPQPMALKVAARAKWNAWQQLGSMNRDVAMEQYIRLLSDSIPGWMHDFSADEDIQACSKIEAAANTGSKITSFPDCKRKVELDCADKGDTITCMSSVEEGTVE